MDEAREALSAIQAEAPRLNYRGRHLWRPDEEERGHLASSTAAFITELRAFAIRTVFICRCLRLPFTRAAGVDGTAGAANCRVP